MNCPKCNIEMIPIELEHVDGNNQNNIKTNLKLLCPNCHALTPTWRGRGTNTGRKTVADEVLLASLIKHDFIVKRALKDVCMTPKGANFERCYELIVAYKINARMEK